MEKGGDFQKLSECSKTLFMTSERMGEMSEGDFAENCVQISASVDGGLVGGCMHKPTSEDLHRQSRKFLI